MSKSHPVPVRYSQPRPAGGASEPWSRTPPASRSTAVAENDGAMRTRCWIVECRRGRRRTCTPAPGDARPRRGPPRWRAAAATGRRATRPSPPGGRERVERVRRDPHDSGVDGLVGALDPLPRQRGEGAGDLDRLLAPSPPPRLRGEVDMRGEAPRAVDDHAHREPHRGLVDDAGHAGVTQVDRLRYDPLDPDVGVLDAQLPGPAQSGVREARERQRAEGGVNPIGVDPVGHDGKLSGRTDIPDGAGSVKALFLGPVPGVWAASTAAGVRAGRRPPRRGLALTPARTARRCSSGPGRGGVRLCVRLHDDREAGLGWSRVADIPSQQRRGAACMEPDGSAWTGPISLSTTPASGGQSEGRSRVQLGGPGRSG